MAVQISEIIIPPGCLSKLSGKHDVTEDVVRDLLQWPARVRVAFDDDVDHGPRWLALASLPDGQQFFAALEPQPEYDGARATIWVLRTAYFL